MVHHLYYIEYISVGSRVTQHTTQEEHSQEVQDQALDWLVVIPLFWWPPINQRNGPPTWTKPHNTSPCHHQLHSICVAPTASIASFCVCLALVACFIVNITSSVNWDKLKPLIIFKGEKNGRIVQHDEFPSNNTYLAHANLNCQKHDIDHILVPYLQEQACKVQFCCFLTTFLLIGLPMFKNGWLREIRITAYKIPPGSTYHASAVYRCWNYQVFEG